MRTRSKTGNTDSDGTESPRKVTTATTRTRSTKSSKSAISGTKSADSTGISTDRKPILISASSSVLSESPILKNHNNSTGVNSPTRTNIKSKDTTTSRINKKVIETTSVKAGASPTSRKWYLRTHVIILLAIIERIIILFWGLYQDANMDLRFTDIDYFVFTDASRFISQGASPYDRATYRYTPLLAWLLLPTEWWFFSFGKVLFAAGDIVAGYLMLQIFKIRKSQVPQDKSVLYVALVWLLNPMVCTISTRGSSEGLLGAMVISFIWAVYAKQYTLGGILAGLAIHFKIYPIIYIPTVIWTLGQSTNPFNFRTFYTKERLVFGISTVLSFSILTGFFYYVYGYPFLHHSYLHHLSRIDHRHNFSPYSTLLYMSSFPGASQSTLNSIPQPEAWAFVPQLAISGILLPLAFARRDLIKTMFVQTFAFVTFNKVCTSQYFMWYMVLLPFYIPSLLKSGRYLTKITVLLLWVAAQALWIRQGYLLEFLGESTFYPGLFAATMVFFAVNAWALGLFIDDL
ncbi:Gpi14p [Sugiyamaella lignohabitans]|uniref:GPI mannosyltransferase 1 n=1 Tax=Sugiyamaella lignohabitans TaxID=796027 RepID=A0A167FEK8_9ASCO|nr:Gpi14p [Sugiyamaella lignohabitans]ANB15202.1 Gpi14p [Sugiyamaella lignohabitans]